MSRWLQALRFARVPAGYLAVAVACTLLLAAAESLIVADVWRSRDHALETLRSDARQATDAKARELSQLLTDVYVTTRTISLLPAVRRPEPRNRVSIDDDAIDGKRFSVTDAQTVLQLYHHLAELLSVSEIYVVYDGFAPERGEVPFLMFDSVIVERIRHLTAGPGARAAGPAAAERPGDEPEQEEGEEYAEIVRQLAQLRRQHPTLPASAPHGVASLMSRPVITCDNSQYLSARGGHDRDRQRRPAPLRVGSGPHDTAGGERRAQGRHDSTPERPRQRAGCHPRAEHERASQVRCGNGQGHHAEAVRRRHHRHTQVHRHDRDDRDTQRDERRCAGVALGVTTTAPAARLRSPSRTMVQARTVAVVVPSPATSSVFLATSLTSSAPIFS